MRKRKLSDVLGIAIDGIDLSRPLSDSAFREIEQAFWDGQVLAIKGQRLEPGQLLSHRGPLGPPVETLSGSFRSSCLSRTGRSAA